MGWKGKGLALVLGLAFFGLGAWPLGLVCFLYLAVTLRPRRGKIVERTATGRSVPIRVVVAAALFLLSAVALASGGTLSPFVFLFAGLAALAWPGLARRLRFGCLAPVGDSILLRSKYLPFGWCAVAELKPGAEPFPMAASSYSGTLIVFTDTGKTYCVATCCAYGRKRAEASLLSSFRGATPRGRVGAYLLPLDAGSAADLLRLRLSPVKLGADLAKSIPGLSGILVVECRGGSATKAAAFSIEGRATNPALPGRTRELPSSPLTWEVFDAIGKRTRWPDPDPYSGLLEAMLATRGVPFAERVAQLESSGEQLNIRSLGGEEVRTTRPQMRAILSIYG